MKRFALRVHCGNGRIENIWSGEELNEARVDESMDAFFESDSDF